MIPGGVPDKLGNGYEANWTIQQVLEVLCAQADSIQIEPFGDDAAGFEFDVRRRNHECWHQCKRRRASGKWSIANLKAEGVLAHFARKLNSSSTKCYFVSGDPTPELKALADKANYAANPEEFEKTLNKEEAMDLAALRSAWSVDLAMAYAWLQRCSVETVSGDTIADHNAIVAGLMFHDSPHRVISELKEYVGNNLNRPLTTEVLRAAVDDLGLRWSAQLDPTINQACQSATERYKTSLMAPIGEDAILTPGTAEAVAKAVSGEQKLLLVSGKAGSGKSAAMSLVLKEAANLGTPVLAFRMDLHLAAVSVQDIGQAVLGQRRSPVGCFGDRHSDRKAILLIDQIDAVSEASGRSSAARALLLQLIAEANVYPNLRIVLACRAYDVENDDAFRKVAKAETSETVLLEPLRWEDDVVPVLAQVGLDERTYTDREKELLSSPINLKLFRLVATDGAELPQELTQGHLFDKLVELRGKELGKRGLGWSVPAALSAIADWMSREQDLTAPQTVLSAYQDGVDALASAGLIVRSGSKIQFAHESFFDHVFAGQFVASGATLLALLQSGEQRLFRRTQVRQILARLREDTQRSYLRNLKEVVESAEVRYLIKDAIGMWMADIATPTTAEADLVLRWHARADEIGRFASAIINGKGWLGPLIERSTITRWLDGNEEQQALAGWLLRKGAATHSSEIASALRRWWSDDAAKVPRLLQWFHTLHPDGAIGDLELLYSDLMAYAPVESIGQRGEEGRNNLGSWVHADPGLGARVLGYWLNRELDASEDAQPFADRGNVDDRYWIKELAQKHAIPFLRSVLPAFARALARDKAQASGVGRYSRQVRLPMMEDDDSWALILGLAGQAAAREDAGTLAVLLQQLPVNDTVATYIKLKAIAANGSELAAQLPILVQQRAELDTDDEEAGWAPFADAGHAAFPHLDEESKRSVEAYVQSLKPELRFAIECAQGLAGDDTNRWNSRDTVIHYLNVAGENERAILTTVGRSNLSESGRSRLDELERKLRGRPLPNRDRMRGGTVNSPIEEDKAARMTDAQWLGAMRAYDGSRERRDFLVGDARQLSSVLQSRAKKEPVRFVAFLARLPEDIHEAYPNGIVHGVREAEGLTAELVKAVFDAVGERWEGETVRTLCWLVQRCPTAAKDPAVLAFLTRVASQGVATGKAVRSTGGKQNDAEAADVRTLLSSARDLDLNGVNEERGSAWEALATSLWNVPEIYDEVEALLVEMIERETENSVRVCMLHAINSVGKYNPSRCVTLLRSLASKDLIPLQGQAGRSLLQWACDRYPAETADITDGLVHAQQDSLRALGRLILCRQALLGERPLETIEAELPSDLLLRRVLGYVAAHSVQGGLTGDRAERLIKPLFDDRERAVRTECSNANWSAALDAVPARVALAEEYIQSEAFSDMSDRLMRELETRISRFPNLTLTAVQRIIALRPGWAGDRRTGHYSTLHHLSKILIDLYREFETDPARETEILDLFDLYLMQQVQGLRGYLEAYERR